MEDKYKLRYFETKENEIFSSLEYEIDGKFHCLLKNVKSHNLHDKREEFSFNKETYELFNDVVTNSNVLTTGLPIYKFGKQTLSTDSMSYKAWKTRMKKNVGVYIFYLFEYNDTGSLMVRGNFIKE